MPVPEYRVIGITGIPIVKPGDDLAAQMVNAAKAQGTPLQSGDVLVVTQKIVSKAENRLVSLKTVTPSPFAVEVASQWPGKDARLVELVLRESKRIVRMDHGVVITETKHGFVCANSGIDQSNIEGDEVVALLPEDSDKSAARIRAEILRTTGADLAVVISDTFGRPWRVGYTNVAIGLSGMNPLADYRGQVDHAGFELKVTVLAIADELCSATEPVMGKVDKVPAAIVRGYAYQPGEYGIATSLREASQDMFR